MLKNRYLFLDDIKLQLATPPSVANSNATAPPCWPVGGSLSERSVARAAAAYSGRL